MLMRICRCGKKIPYEQKLCDECRKQQGNTKHSQYNKYIRDKESQSIYNSMAWKKVREAVISRDNDICRLCFDNGRITKKDLIHHIEPVKDNIQQVYNINNLICLCNKCHTKVHKQYEQKNLVNKTKEKLKTLIAQGFT